MKIFRRFLLFLSVVKCLPAKALASAGQLSVVATPVFAQLKDLPTSPTTKFTHSGLIGQILSQIIPIVLGIAGFITVIVIVLSGIQFITSSGNPEAAAAAKNRLLFAIIGLVIIILAFAVLQIINAVFLGTEIV